MAHKSWALKPCKHKFEAWWKGMEQCVLCGRYKHPDGSILPITPGQKKARGIAKKGVKQCD